MLTSDSVKADMQNVWFGKLKYFRRVATHCEKKVSHFMEMLTFAAVLLWLR